MEMFSKKYVIVPRDRPNRSSRSQRIRRSASWFRSASRSGRFRFRNGWDLRRSAYASSAAQRLGPVMHADRRVLRPEVKAGGEELRGVPRVREQERGPMRCDQVVAPAEGGGLFARHVGPLAHPVVRGNGFWPFDRDPDALRDSDVDLLDGPPDAAKECRHLVRGAHGRAEPDPLNVAPG